MRRPRTLSLGLSLWAIAGPVIWMLHLSAVYAVETVACLPSIAGATGVGAIAAGLTTLAYAALLATGIRQVRQHRMAPTRFLAEVGLYLSALSTIAVLFTVLAVPFFPGCSGF